MKRVGMPDLRRAFWFGLAAALVLLVVRPASAQMLGRNTERHVCSLWHSQR